MYDIPEVHQSTMQIVDAIAGALCNIGIDAHGDVPHIVVHADLVRHWTSDQTIVSQSCGLPFVEELHEFVDVIGTPLWADVSNDRGWYRTVIVARESLGRTSIGDLRGLRPAVNNPQSLSGWCSLGVAIAQVTTDTDFAQPYAISGGHGASLAMLHNGTADFASIDAATWQILSVHRPTALQGIGVVGYGPVVPATPYVVSKKRTASMDEVGRAVSDVFDRPELQLAMREIGMSGFVRLANSDYDMLSDLVKIAEVVLPRQ